VYIKVRVKTEQKKEVVTRESPDHFEISLKEPAERNLANSRILEIFRELFPEKPVRIISGHHSPSKIISIDSEG
jgi:uncharacterized protein (TIGR00251 family)